MGEMMQAIAILGDKSLQLTQIARPEPKAGEVRIAIKAAGLNRADLVQRAGRYPPPPGAPETMGLECSGTIEAVGEGVTGWSVGDKVCALLAGGGYAEAVCVDQGSLLPVPEGMSYVEAAALPEALITVWANMYDRAGLKKGESVLIHGGTSGIGTTAIQMARQYGAPNIYTTQGSDGKCALATSLGSTRAINYKTEDFVEIVSETGVDVILDMVGGDYVQRNISACNPDGRIINIAYMQGFETTVNFAFVLMKRLSLMATTLRARPAAEKARLRAGMQDVFWSDVKSGAIKPIIDSVYPLAEADAAQARMTSMQHSGKIILEV